MTKLLAGGQGHQGLTDSIPVNVTMEGKVLDDGVSGHYLHPGPVEAFR